jgi:hypothetical protein
MTMDGSMTPFMTASVALMQVTEALERIEIELNGGESGPCRRKARTGERRHHTRGRRACPYRRSNRHRRQAVKGKLGRWTGTQMIQGTPLPLCVPAEGGAARIAPLPRHP